MKSIKIYRFLFQNNIDATVDNKLEVRKDYPELIAAFKKENQEITGLNLDILKDSVMNIGQATLLLNKIQQIGWKSFANQNKFESTPYVAAVQTALDYLGFNNVGKIDGIIGGNTEAAVKMMQSKHKSVYEKYYKSIYKKNIPTTDAGKIGDATINTILELLNGATPNITPEPVIPGPNDTIIPEPEPNPPEPEFIEKEEPVTQQNLKESFVNSNITGFTVHKMGKVGHKIDIFNKTTQKAPQKHTYDGEEYELIYVYNEGDTKNPVKYIGISPTKNIILGKMLYSYPNFSFQYQLGPASTIKKENVPQMATKTERQTFCKNILDKTL